MAGAIIQTDVLIRPQGLEKWCNNLRSPDQVWLHSPDQPALSGSSVVTNIWKSLSQASKNPGESPASVLSSLNVLIYQTFLLSDAFL